MKWFLGTYTGRFNRRHKLFGHLFSGRYKALIVDGSGSGYLKTVCDYVHLNPARAKLLRPEQPLRAYRWSSWPEYLKKPRQRPAVAAGGPVAGRDENPQGQSGGAAGVGATGRGAAQRGGRGNLQTHPAGMVFWGEDVQEGIAGADEGTDGGGALRGGAAGDGGSAGGRDYRGGIETTWLARGRFRSTSQGRYRQSGVGGAVACGDGHDGEMDRGTIADGGAGLCESSLVSSAESW